MTNFAAIDWEATKTLLAVWGAITGSLGLLLQYWKHHAERSRFVIACEMSVHIERGKQELRIRATATNHGQRRGYIQQFKAEFSPELPFHSVEFVGQRDAPIAVEPDETKSFEVTVPVDYYGAIADKVTLSLSNTTGQRLTKQFPTIGPEVLEHGGFTGPYFSTTSPGGAEGYTVRPTSKN